MVSGGAVTFVVALSAVLGSPSPGLMVNEVSDTGIIKGVSTPKGERA